jgi:hypothetical protein
MATSRPIFGSCAIDFTHGARSDGRKNFLGTEFRTRSQGHNVLTEFSPKEGSSPV